MDSRELLERQISEGQRLDKHYYDVARSGYDCSTGETDMAALQRYAARRSRPTRERLLALVDQRPA